MFPWLTLPASLSCLLDELRPCFTGPGFVTFCGLAAGLGGRVRHLTVAGMLHLDIDRMMGLVQDFNIQLWQGIGPAAASGVRVWGGSGAAAEQEIVNAGSTAGGRSYVQMWDACQVSKRSIGEALGGPMRHESSEFGPSVPPGTGDGEATRTFVERTALGRAQPVNPADQSADAPTEMLPHPPTEVARHGSGIPASVPAGQAGQVTEPAFSPGRPAEIVRYGPGVPATPSAGQAGLAAERMWQASGPARPPRRSARLRRLAGSALTVILLAASGVVLYLRFHHAPFHVTGVAITQQAKAGCAVDVTGRISTNGSAGTVSYQWLFRPDQQAAQPLSQSVTAGQHAVYVTVAVQGSGQGNASETVTLQVLGPEFRAASAGVVVSCR